MLNSHMLLAFLNFNPTCGLESKTPNLTSKSGWIRRVWLGLTQVAPLVGFDLYMTNMHLTILQVNILQNWNLPCECLRFGLDLSAHLTISPKAFTRERTKSTA